MVNTSFKMSPKGKDQITLSLVFTWQS